LGASDGSPALATSVDVADSCSVAALDSPASLALRTSTSLDVDAAFREHYPFVLRALVCLGVTPIDADDVAQEVFVIAHRRRDDFDGDRRPRAWLYGIARRLARSRRRARTTDVLDALPAATVGDPERAAAHSQALSVALRCLDRLSPKLREVFVLSELEGLAAPEVAQLLELPVNTVYSRLRLGRERFDAVLTKLRAQESDR
jgi:RNA polymerase sigma-70 factor, ECF subfamily